MILIEFVIFCAFFYLFYIFVVRKYITARLERKAARDRLDEALSKCKTRADCLELLKSPDCRTPENCQWIIATADSDRIKITDKLLSEVEKTPSKKVSRKSK